MNVWTMIGLLAAAQPGLRFEWVRAPDAAACPDRRAVLAAAREAFGALPLPLSDTSSASVEGLATCTSTGCAARLVVFDAAGRAIGGRRLESARPDCVGLVERVVLALSLLSGAAPIPRTPVRLDSRAAALDNVETAPIAARDVWHVRGAVSARVVLHAGILPGEVGGGASIAVRAPQFSIFELGGGVLYLPQRRTEAIGVALTAAFVEGCAGGAVLDARFDLRACARGYLGASHVAVVSDEFLRSTGAGAYLWSGASAVERTRVWIWGPIFGVLELEVLAAITRRTFQVAFREELSFRESAFSFLGSFGVGASF